MKKLYTILAAVLVTASTFAQAPEKMSYQAVVRDSGDNLVTSQVVGMRISILQGTTAVYVETQTPTTNVNGLVTLEIGGSSATVVSGIFSTIDWSTGTYFIKTETDPTGDTTYTITGTSQLLSVPYALQSKTATTATTLPGGIDQGYIEALEARIVALEQPPEQPPAIGDIREGGVVFWVDGNGGGLVCAFSDYPSTGEWGCYGTDLPSVPNVAYNGGNPVPVGPGAEIGDGEDNTTGILAYCSSSPAALAARSYGAEWFLPSINELNEIYINRATLEAVPEFSAFSNDYWSSTEIHHLFAWEQNFTNGGQNAYGFKDFTDNSVRAVRAF
jgi:hypothetical protein